MKGNGEDTGRLDAEGGADVGRSQIQGETDVMEFPCSYPLKVMGKNTEEFYAVVSAIIGRHVPGSDRVTYIGRASSGDKYLSITATFSAESREQLDAIYRDLNGNELVIYTM